MQAIPMRADARRITPMRAMPMRTRRDRLIRFILAALAVLQAACTAVQAPLLDDGPGAIVRDTWVGGGSGAIFYVLESVGEIPVLRTSLSVARSRSLASGGSYGQLPSIDREVPAGPVLLTIRARQAWASGTELIFQNGRHADVLVSIQVELGAGEEYLVRGNVGDGGDQLWIESARTGQRVPARPSVSPDREATVEPVIRPIETQTALGG